MGRQIYRDSILKIWMPTLLTSGSSWERQLQSADLLTQLKGCYGSVGKGPTTQASGLLQIPVPSPITFSISALKATLKPCRHFIKVILIFLFWQWVGLLLQILIRLCIQGFLA